MSYFTFTTHHTANVIRFFLNLEFLGVMVTSEVYFSLCNVNILFQDVKPFCGLLGVVLMASLCSFHQIFTLRFSYLVKIYNQYNAIILPIFIFSDLRLQLLDTLQNMYLLKSLYGLLMLLPQSDAFRTLRHRLECVPHLQLLPPEERYVYLFSLALISTHNSWECPSLRV